MTPADSPPPAGSSPADRPTIGVLGTGNMGGNMALRLLDLGYRVAVHDIDAAAMQPMLERDARHCADAASLARCSDVVIVALVDAAQCDDALFGGTGEHCFAAAAGGPGPPPTVMLCPTLGPDQVEAIEARLAALGMPMIEAPLSGGPHRARDGTMSLMAAGPADLRRRHRQLLADLSTNVFEVGERIGDGARTKLVNNLLAATQLAAAADAMVLAQTWGLDPLATLAVVEQSSGQSWVGSDRMRRTLRGDRTPMAHMRLLAKDSRLAVSAARAAGHEPVIGAQVADLFDRACRGGLEAMDDGQLFRWLGGRVPD